MKTSLSPVASSLSHVSSKGQWVRPGDGSTGPLLDEILHAAILVRGDTEKTLAQNAYSMRQVRCTERFRLAPLHVHDQYSVKFTSPIRIPCTYQALFDWLGVHCWIDELDVPVSSYAVCNAHTRISS